MANSSMENGNPESTNWDETFESLEKDYKEAYFTIDKAIKLDEAGKLKEALPLYESGLSKIDNALDISMTEPTKPNINWEKAIAMTQKLRKTRKEVLIRIEKLKSKPSVAAPELPPSYEDAVSSSKPDTLGASNNGNTSQLPGPSNLNTPYIPPSAAYDQDLLANLNINGEENTDSPMTYSALSQQLKEMKLAKNEEILFHCENVQLHFIAPDGRVSSTFEPNTLIIARINDATSSILDEALQSIVSDLTKEIYETRKRKHKHHHSLLHKKRHPHRKNKKRHSNKDEGPQNIQRTFLQVGSWVYPLIPEMSPCIRSEIGAFIFPDINSNIEGAAVGVILPEEATEEVHELFTHLLNEVTATGRTRRSVAADPTKECPSKFVRGAAYLAYNLIRGAGTTARFIDSSTPRLMNHITPTPEPQAINPALQKTVEVAKTVSGKAVDVTDYLATKISMATSALGRYLSPYIQKSGSRLIQSTTTMSEEEANEKINTFLSATSDAVTGVATVYKGLDTAASILARSLANNTVQIIEHRYGHPAGVLTNDAITTFGNVYYTRHNFRVLRPRGIAKAAVKGAGAALLKEARSKHSTKSQEPQEPQEPHEPHEEFKGSGPGDGSGFSKNC